MENDSIEVEVLEGRGGRAGGVVQQPIGGNDDWEHITPGPSVMPGRGRGRGRSAPAQAIGPGGHYCGKNVTIIAGAYITRTGRLTVCDKFYVL